MPDAKARLPHDSQTCSFCRIIRGEEQASIVFEDSFSLAFLDHRPLFPGHSLLVPREHFETLADLPASIVGPLFQNAQLLERAIEEVYWLLRASVRKIINFVFRHPIFLCLMVLIFKFAGKCFKNFGIAFLRLR